MFKREAGNLLHLKKHPPPKKVKRAEICTWLALLDLDTAVTPENKFKQGRPRFALPGGAKERELC